MSEEDRTRHRLAIGIALTVGFTGVIPDDLSMQTGEAVFLPVPIARSHRFYKLRVVFADATFEVVE